jgi:imidazolonepropionase-like amidohydrolase
MSVFNRAGTVIAGIIIVSLATFALLPTPSHEAPVKQPGNSFAVRGVRVFDGRHVIQHANVVVHDGLIEAIGADAAIPSGIPVYDGAGKTLIPGLIDAHVHTYDHSRRNALRFGVTTELGMFTDWHLLAAADEQRQTLARTDKADLWSGGMIPTVPHGHGTEYGAPVVPITKASQARHWVDQRIKEGSDYIGEIVLDDGSLYGMHMPTLTPAEVKALIDAAHKRGKMAIIHIATRSDARLAIDDGVDGLAHVFADKLATPAFIHDIKKHGTFVIATLSVYSAVACGRQAKHLLDDAHLKPFLSNFQVNALKRSFPSCTHGVFKTAMKNVHLLHSAGVPILAGTDAGNPGTAHGASLHGELALLVKAGLSPSQALNAATALPAKLFHLDDRGRIAKGLRADLVLVNGNPTKNIKATRDIAAIWMNGYRVNRKASSTSAAHAGKTNQAKPAPAGLISDFDGGKITSRYGRGWVVTTDQLRGGQSVAKMKLIEPGAQDSAGALKITGTVKGGFAYPWAGVLFFPGDKPMVGARDYSGKKTLTFRARGDGGTFDVMVFAGPSVKAAAMPIIRHFKAGSRWHKVSLPLKSFQNVDLKHLRGIAFTAGPATGDFHFAIDQVAIK